MTVAQEPRTTRERLGERGRELYERLRVLLNTLAAEAVVVEVAA